MGKGVDWVKSPVRDAPITPRLRSPACRSAALLRRCPAASGAERHYAGLAQISHFFSSTPTAQNLPLPPLTNRRLPFFCQSGATIRSPAEREAASALNAAAFHNNGIKGGGGGGGVVVVEEMEGKGCVVGAGTDCVKKSMVAKLHRNELRFENRINGLSPKGRG